MKWTTRLTNGLHRAIPLKSSFLLGTLLCIRGGVLLGADTLQRIRPEVFSQSMQLTQPSTSVPSRAS